MYIEFDVKHIYLPTLIKELDNWYYTHQIQFHIKKMNYKLKVTFAEPEHYTFFCLTWNPKSVNTREYKLIEPMKIDKKD
jgi:hypothetical protein